MASASRAAMPSASAGAGGGAGAKKGGGAGDEAEGMGQVAGFTCFACRVAKVKCDKEWPCGRCKTMELECISQGKGPGRPAKAKPPKPKRAYARRQGSSELSSTSSTSSSGSAAGGVAALPPLPPLPPQGGVSVSDFIAAAVASGGGCGGKGEAALERRGRKHKARGDEDEDEGAGAGGGNDGAGERPLEIFSRAQKVQRRMRMSRFPVPERLAELMTGALSRALDARVVDDRKALAVLRLWSLCAFTQGHDFTWGLLNNASMLLERAGYKPQATKDFVFYGPEPEDSLTLPNPSFDWREMPEALRLLDDGGVSAISSYIFIDGVFRMYANQTFSDMFMTPYELNVRMAEEQIMPVFVWTRCFDEGEKTAFLELMITVAYTQGANAGEASRVLNALDRNGQSVPCLVRVRYMFLNQGSYCAMVVSFFPLPATITEGPSPISARSISITAGNSQLSATSNHRTPQLPTGQLEGPPPAQALQGPQHPFPAITQGASHHHYHAHAHNPPIHPAAHLPPVREESGGSEGEKEGGGGAGGVDGFEAVLARLDTPAVALHPDNSEDWDGSGSGNAQGRPRGDSIGSAGGASYASHSSYASTTASAGSSSAASSSAAAYQGQGRQQQQPPPQPGTLTTTYYFGGGSSVCSSSSDSSAASSPVVKMRAEKIAPSALQPSVFPPGSEAMLREALADGGQWEMEMVLSAQRHHAPAPSSARQRQLSVASSASAATNDGAPRFPPPSSFNFAAALQPQHPGAAGVGGGGINPPPPPMQAEAVAGGVFDPSDMPPLVPMDTELPALESLDAFLFGDGLLDGEEEAGDLLAGAAAGAVGGGGGGAGIVG